MGAVEDAEVCFGDAVLQCVNSVLHLARVSVGKQPVQSLERRLPCTGENI